MRSFHRLQINGLCHRKHCTKAPVCWTNTKEILGLQKADSPTRSFYSQIMTTPVLVYLLLQIAPSQPCQQLFSTKHAGHPRLTYSHSTNTLSIDTTKHTPRDSVLQHTPAVTARSGGTEHKGTLQPIPVFPVVANHSQIQWPIHSLPWTNQKQKAIPNATT